MNKYFNLLDYRKIKYSIIGNDGIVEFIFKTINIKKGFFVEFGAWDDMWRSALPGFFYSWSWTGR